ncbi:type II toxin-antitoxin system RelE/ParE family toxin [Beijerinckia sp. L45]|uniref:type II toxin-antitoxin system RelE/ParE family toxin n=1 Tax=Beijerinckia sp. L45 TaxID=1641855 RepID=UPI00131AAC5B|nr:type II toxin-antitoxin system RelE/ParE family toxin [Beijerinckia sp. L45]
MRLFKTKWFNRFARQEQIADRALVEAIASIGRGAVDADRGGEIFKQRVARTGAGKSGGYRVLVAYRSGDRSVFLFGFAKNERDNITVRELNGLRDLGKLWLDASERDIRHAIELRTLHEIGPEEVS